MFSLSSPLSLYAIPAMWVISYYPAYARSKLVKQLDGFNNVQPRSNVARLAEKKDVPPELIARLHRIEGAHANGLENLPFFGLAVLAGNYAGVDNVCLNIASGAYLALRVLYNYIYFNQASQKAGFARTFTWIASIGCSFYILLSSASIVAQK